VVFKDMKKMMEGANQAAAASAGLAQAGAGQMAVFDQSTLDPNDPVFEPIEGISLERYAELCAGLVKNNVATEESAHAWVESQGVAPGSWKAVSEGWNKRMGEKPALAMRYNDLFQKANGTG
jgi:hypothetical protein